MKNFLQAFSLVIGSWLVLVGLSYFSNNFVSVTPVAPVIETAYPAPYLELSPYPAPEIAVTTPVINCEEHNKWVTYKNERGGYTIEYPAGFQINNPNMEISSSLSFRISRACYEEPYICSGKESVGLSLRDNPDNLPVEEFVEQYFDSYTDPSFRSMVQNFANNSYIYVDGVESLWIENSPVFEQTYVFVPLDEKILVIYTAIDTRMPPFDPPCDETLAIFQQMVASIKFIKFFEKTNK